MERLTIEELLDAYDNIMRVTTSGTPLYQRAESVRYYLQQLLHYQKLDVSFDHLRDLIQAENDGRLVVLPCGNDAELTRNGYTFSADHWNHFLTAFRDAPENKSGKQIELFSISEVEAALAGKGGEG